MIDLLHFEELDAETQDAVDMVVRMVKAGCTSAFVSHRRGNVFAKAVLHYPNGIEAAWGVKSGSGACIARGVRS